MGMISVSIGGSFSSASNKGHRVTGSKQFSALTHGHAHAVQEAIAFLTNDVLPVAINLDHELHDDGEAPNAGFAKSK